MRREIVEHDADIEAGLDARTDLAQKCHEVLRTVLEHAPGDHFTGRHSEQIERAMANVVAGQTLGLTDVHRQDRPRALQRLDLRCATAVSEASIHANPMRARNARARLPRARFVTRTRRRARHR